MTVSEIKTKLIDSIEHLSDTQVEQLYAMMKQSFPEKTSSKASGLLGSMPNLIKYIAPDFNEPLEDFKDYMPE